MKKIVYQIIFLMLFLLSGSCLIGLPKNPSTKELYESFLNLKLSKDISDFNGEGKEGFPAITSRAYFTYKVDPQYFEVLEKHDKFIEENDFNERIHSVSCDSSEFIIDFSYWTDQNIDLTDKNCFTGVIFPFAHYFVFDPITEETHHFVTGMSD